MDRVGATLLWARAGLLTLVVLGTGSLAHASAAGRMPGPATLALLAAITCCGSAVLLTRPAGRLRVVLLTVAGQTWVHVVLTLSAGHAGDHRGPVEATAPAVPAPARGRARTGSLLDYYEAHRPQVVDDGPSVPSPVLHLFADLTGAHAPMMALHLGAAAVVGLWLASGESALWTLLAALTGAAGAVVLGAVVVPALPRPADGRALGAAPVPHPQQVIGRCVVRRGPPALLAA